MQKKEKWSYVVSALKIEQYPNGTRIDQDRRDNSQVSMW